MWECHSAAISPMKRQRMKSSLMTSNCVRKTKAVLRWVELSYAEVDLFWAQKWITILWVCKTAPTLTFSLGVPLLTPGCSGWVRLCWPVHKSRFLLYWQKSAGVILSPQSWGLCQFWWTISNQKLRSILPLMSPPGLICKNTWFYLSGWNHFFPHKTDVRAMCQCGGDSGWLVAESVLL